MTATENIYDLLPAAEPDMLVRNMNSRTKSQPCGCVNCTFGRSVLRAKQNLAGDLASHMFGHLVSTEVARQILTTFVVDGVVQVFEGEIAHYDQSYEAPLDPHSEDAQDALAQAFEVAKAHDCIPLHAKDASANRSLSPDQEEREKKTYSFRWRWFPQGQVRPDELVSFFNEITDRAFAAAKSHLATTKLKLRHRFAVPEDRRHFVPLYDPDQERISPPEFFLLPIQAFSGEALKTVDKRYLNFSAARLVGESNEDLAAGFDRTQWYAQGLSYAQPWIYYVLAMTFSQPHDLVIFSRVDHSNWEHLTLMLWDGRGCIELIRILLGLALADGVDLGQNPAIQLMCQEHTFKLDPPSDAASSNADSHLDATDSDDDAMSVRTCSSASCDSAPASSCQSAVEKRNHSVMEEDDGREDARLKKAKTTDTMNTE